MTDENQTTNRINVEYSPGFILEVSPGSFRQLKALNWKFKSKCDIYENILLEEGLNIREVPTRNLSVLIEDSETDSYKGVRSTIETLRNWAIISGFDYYSFLIKNEQILTFIGNDGLTDYYKVIPRFFRKIHDD